MHDHHATTPDGTVVVRPEAPRFGGPLVKTFLPAVSRPYPNTAPADTKHYLMWTPAVARQVALSLLLASAEAELAAELRDLAEEAPGG